MAIMALAVAIAFGMAMTLATAHGHYLGQCTGLGRHGRGHCPSHGTGVAMVMVIA